MCQALCFWLETYNLFLPTAFLRGWSAPFEASEIRLSDLIKTKEKKRRKCSWVLKRIREDFLEERAFELDLEKQIDSDR